MEEGRDNERRRQWIEIEMQKLVVIFALDITAYAVKSNYYHVVLYIDAKTANT
ncbi:hypothetical protein [Microbulbifer sp. SSSA005]|uniref:hypothetical protein n=1 Tax=Microbulbifer sp. SSSA005 TaxID=3243378 RepID=UPI00403A5F12